MTTWPPAAALDAYGLRGSKTEQLAGGVINRVWRVDTASGSFVLKHYISGVSKGQIRSSVLAANVAGSRGLPVPAVFPTLDGEIVCELPDGPFVLSEFVAGRLFDPGTIPPTAARNMGRVLAQLHDALRSLPPGSAKPLPLPDVIEEQLRNLLEIARSRRGDRVDAIAEAVLEAKLELLSTIDTVPDYLPQWTHGDFEWRNVLFDSKENVAAVFDFDELQYFSPARDVMRCIALSFPGLELEADDFFAGYAEVRRLTPEEARSYVDFYRYISTHRVWPISARYLDTEHYQQRWADFIQPILPWDWKGLSDRLAQIAATTAERYRNDFE